MGKVWIINFIKFVILIYSIIIIKISNISNIFRNIIKSLIFKIVSNNRNFFIDKSRKIVFIKKSK
jgi:hypothetical protein